MPELPEVETVKKSLQELVLNKVIKEVPNQYFIYNKPIGVVCTNDLNVKNNIISHLNLKDRLFCVGRLDKDSHGLLILTNDGVFSNKLINGKNHIEKEYLVKVKDVTKIGKTADQIKNINNVSLVRYGEGMVEKLVNAFSSIQKVTYGIVIALILVTIFLIVNTIKLTISARKREIGIMRLVGASNFTIKTPFIVEGMILGALGSIVPILITLFGYTAFYTHFNGYLFSQLIQLIKPEPFIYSTSLIILVIGIIHTAFRGRGMSFSEVREYRAGDDVRDIDWNVTARFNKPYIKVFEEERELTVMLIVDLSDSLDFGTSVRTKRETLTEIAATIAFAAIQNNDKIGVIFFTDKVEKFIPPQKGRKHILYIIRELLNFEPDSKSTDIKVPLQYLTNAIKKRCTAFLLSDFICDTDSE